METTEQRNTQKIVYENILQSLIKEIEKKKESQMLVEDRFYPKNRWDELHKIATKQALKDIANIFNKFLIENI